MAVATMARPPKLVIFGIDSADLTVMAPWLAEGRLPHLAGLIERGAAGPLRSLIPPITPSAWTTIMTGTNPGRHGVLDFVLPRPHSYGRRIASARDCREPGVWSLVNRGGHSCGVLNVPFTYPPTEVDGYMMSGSLGGPKFSEAVVQPHALFAELQRAIGDFPMDPAVRSSTTYDLPALDHQIRQTAAACNYLMATYPMDVFVAVVAYVDHIQHFFYGRRALPDDPQRIPDVVLYGYEAADRLLGEVLARCDEETHVLIVSDHGAGPLKGYVNIDKLLQEAGLLRFRDKVGSSGRLRRLMDEPPAWLGRLFPSRLRGRVAKELPEQFEARFDWQHTLAFPRRPSGGLYLNLQGREPEGIIPAADYERRREEIIATLLEAFANYPQLQPARIYRREELYHGPALDLAPDIIYSLDDFAMQPTCCHYPNARTVMTVDEAMRVDVQDSCRTGWHAMEGVLIAAGPKVAAGARPEHAELADVTPTALELLGVTADQEFDGRVLDEILVPAARPQTVTAIH